MKKLASILLVLLLMMSLVGCDYTIAKKSEIKNEDTTEKVESTTEVVNNSATETNSKSYMKEYGYVEKLDEKGLPVNLYTELTDVNYIMYVVEAHKFKSGETIYIDWYLNDELVINDVFPLDEDINGNYLEFHIGGENNLPGGEYSVKFRWGDNGEFTSSNIKVVNTEESATENSNSSTNSNSENSLDWHYFYEYENIASEADMSLSILNSKLISIEDLKKMGFADPELKGNQELYLLKINLEVSNAKYTGKNGASNDSYFPIIFDPNIVGIETEYEATYIGGVQDYGFDGCFNDMYDEATEQYSSDNYTLKIKTGDKLPSYISATGDVIVIVEKNVTNFLKIRNDEEYLLLEIPK